MNLHALGNGSKKSEAIVDRWFNRKSTVDIRLIEFNSSLMSFVLILMCVALIFVDIGFGCIFAVCFFFGKWAIKHAQVLLVCMPYILFDYIMIHGTVKVFYAPAFKKAYLFCTVSLYAHRHNFPCGNIAKILITKWLVRARMQYEVFGLLSRIKKRKIKKKN